MRKRFHLSDQEISIWTGNEAASRINFLPKRSALIVIDMQDYFCDPNAPAFLDSTPFINEHLVPLIESYLRSNLAVVFTRHIDSEDPRDIMNRWWRGKIERDGEWSALSPPFRQQAAGAEVIEKNRYDAFHGTRLEELLRSRGVEQVVIGGVMTHLCCETTARAAFTRGFPAFFLVDGTASSTKRHHEAALLNLKHGFATLVSTSFVRDSLG